jgi:hypothetical protein
MDGRRSIESEKRQIQKLSEQLKSIKHKNRDILYVRNSGVDDDMLFETSLSSLEISSDFLDQSYSADIMNDPVVVEKQREESQWKQTLREIEDKIKQFDEAHTRNIKDMETNNNVSLLDVVTFSLHI